MLRIFITGGTGFLGSHLTQALKRRGVYIVQLIRDTLRGSYAPLICADALVYGQVEDLDCLERAIAEYEVDTVIHLAAQTAVSTASKDPMGTFRANILGTLNVLEACRRQAVKRVVVASSDKAYDQNATQYTEQTPLFGLGPYGGSKTCSDVLAHVYAQTYNMSVAITRCGNLFGPGHHNFSTLIPGTIKRVLECQKPIVRFGGEATRDFLYIDDAVEAYIALATSNLSGAFNFSGGKARKVIDVVKMIIEKIGSDVEPEILHSGIGEIKNQELDCTKAKTLLGWSPHVDFETGLDHTIEYYRKFFRASPKLSLV